MASEYKLSKTAAEIETILTGALVKGATLGDTDKELFRTTIGINETVPKVTASDNGKFLRVVDGKWLAVSLGVYNGEVVN